MRKTTLALIILSIIGLMAYPGNAQESGGYAGSLLRYGVGGRAMGMGRAFVAVADDASGVYWNPAGILGAGRIELTSMYSNLYYDSEYSHIGIVFPRPAVSKNFLLRFLFGPSTALGFAWVGLSTSGFEQRSQTAELLGEFGIQEYALMGAWAREQMSSWGTLRYGFNVKFLRQSFSGLQPTSTMDYNGLSGMWSTGMDIGLTFQPLHAPIFNKFSLRSVLPLRFGIVLQNLLQPYWAAHESHKDLFPRVLRWGLSYRIFLYDWIPESWEALRSMIQDVQILAAFDQVIYENKHRGVHLGAEIVIPLTPSGIALFPRFGYNDRSDGTTLGLGIRLPFTKQAVIRLDYAYSMHNYLADDNRFFMTLQVAKPKKAAYFHELSQSEGLTETQYKHYLYRILSEYPEGEGHLRTTLSELKNIDSGRKKRYLALLEGLELAEYLHSEVINAREEEDDRRARSPARDADRHYLKAYTKNEDDFSDTEYLHWGEILLFLGESESAYQTFNEIANPDLRTKYLKGITWKARARFDSAIVSIDSTEIRQSRESPEMKASMVGLIILHNAECFYRLGKYSDALVHLDMLTRIKNYTDSEYSQSLDSRYPRFPRISDSNMVDDAQVLKALCYLRLAESVPARNQRMKKYKEGVLELVNTFRFFPYLNYGVSMERNSEALIKALREENEGQLKKLTDQIENAFLLDREWPAQN